MRKLYPAVDESVTPLPRFWTSHKELSSKLIIQQGTRVEYKGPGSKGYKDAASARTNTEIPAEEMATLESVLWATMTTHSISMHNKEDTTVFRAGTKTATVIMAMMEMHFQNLHTAKNMDQYT